MVGVGSHGRIRPLSCQDIGQPWVRLSDESHLPGTHHGPKDQDRLGEEDEKWFPAPMGP